MTFCDRKNWLYRFSVAGFTATGIVAFSINQALAQRRPVADNTLGNESSRVVQDAEMIDGILSDRIEGGATRGENLFHSFSEFNIDEGRGAYFSNPEGIRNILSRVTGRNTSEILGRLGVLGDANLFLLNPNGIIFGPNASLDIRGSFVVSAGDRFTFLDGSEFSALNPQAAPLLTVSVPTGVQYGVNSTGNISSQGNLSVGQDLTLAANNISWQGQLQAGRNLVLQSQDTLQIRDSVAHPVIAVAGEQMLFQGNQTIDIFALNHPNSGFYSGGDMVLRSANAVRGDAHFNSGDRFRIENLDNSLGDLLSPYDPIVRASGDVSFNSYTGASLHILAGGSVTITGDITITTPDTTGNALVETIQLSNGRTIRIDGTAQPTLDIRAGTTVVQSSRIIGEIDGVLPTLEISGNSTSADIRIDGNIINPGGLVSITNLYQPNLALTDGTITTQDISTSTTLPENNGGDIRINARGSIQVDNLESFSSSPPRVNNALTGNAGSVELYASNGDIETGKVFAYSGLDPFGEPFFEPTSVSFISGNGGNISLFAANGNIVTNDSLSSASTSASTIGNASSGNGGNISLSAAGEINTIRSVLSASALSNSETGNITTGNGGNISFYTTNGDINAGSLDTFTANVSTTANTAIGDAGNINLYAGSGAVTVEGFLTAFSQASSNSDSQVFNAFAGNGGDINIYANGDIALNVGATSRSFTFADSLVNAVAGNGGDINLYTANGDIFVDGASSPSYSLSSAPPDSATGTTTSQNGGDISFHAANGGITISEFGDLSSSSFSEVGNTGRGGDISLYATEDINTSSINTSSKSGSGDIQITTQGNIFLRQMVSYPQVTPTSFESGAVITTDTFGAGTGGDIQISSQSIFLANGSQISASTHSTGHGGSITVQVSNLIEIDGTAPENLPPGSVFLPGGLVGLPDGTFLGGYVPTGNAEAIDVQNPPRDVEYPSGIFSQTTQNSSGNAGTVFVQADRLIVRDGAAIATTTFGQGSAGNITINAPNGSVLVDNASILSGVAGGSAGNSGAIDVQTGSLSVTNGGLVQTQTLDQGNAGAIRVNADDIRLSGANSALRSGSGGSNELLGTLGDSIGQGGDITVTTNSLTIADGATLDAQTQSSSRGGDITIDTNTLEARNGGQLTTTTLASGRAGDITVRASELNLVGASSGLFAQTESIGEAGQLTLQPRGTAPSLTVNFRDGAEISASTTSSGQGGSLTVTAPRSLILSGDGSLSARSVGSGAAGNLAINTGHLTVQDQTQVSVSSSDSSEAGNLSVQANRILLNNQARLSAETVSGSGGNIQLRIPNLLHLRSASEISASTIDGQGGRLSIDSGQLVVQGRNSSISATSQSGEGGNMTIDAEQLSIHNGGEISASTYTGQAGRLRINADESVNLNNGRLAVQATGDRGRGGNVIVRTEDLLIEDRAAISASTATRTGEAGSIRINASDSVQLREAGSISVEATEGGIAGGLQINTGQLTVEEGSAVSVSSPDGTAGNLNVTADAIQLDRGFLRADIGEAFGAEIDLQLQGQGIQMQNGSRISARAGRNATGGNVTINAPNGFVVAFPNENNDIVADAVAGSGGKINITAQGIFGLEERAADLDSTTNDIDASSAFGAAGTVNLNPLSTDPTQGLVELPADVVDASNQIVQACPTGEEVAESQNEFVITGRGGLPPTPQDVLSGEAIQVGLITSEGESLDGDTEEDSSASALPSPAITEAQGWVVNEKGDVVLLAEVPVPNSSFGHSSITCPDSEDE
ncbi:MAG: hypothetical protein Kow00121_21910 [Elainellaceae cyanobacterium]